jgi:hypothetical protein
VKWQLKCRWAKQVDLLVAGPLSAQETAVVEQHLAGCPACQRQRAELSTLARKLAESVPAEVSPRLGFEARWRRAVAETQQPRQQGLAVRGAISLWRFVREQRRGLLALSVAWVLIAFLRFDAPFVAPELGAATPVVSWREFVAFMKTPEQSLHHLAEATEPGTGQLTFPRTPRSALPTLRNEASLENEGGFYERNSSVAVAA